MDEKTSDAETQQKAKKKLFIGVVTAALVAVAATLFAYIIFRDRENSGHHPEYGDLPTWLTFVAAAVGIPFALYQLRLQRRQLAEQQKSIAEEFARQQKRDRLLDEQLAQAHAENWALMRRQAEQVNVIFAERGNGPAGFGSFPDPYHLAVVENRSQRPIRSVRSSIQLVGREEVSSAQIVGALSVLAESGNLRQTRVTFSKQGDEQELIRPGEGWAFLFPFPENEFRGARMSVYFTDDAGTAWTIDHDLHLEPVRGEHEAPDPERGEHER